MPEESRYVSPIYYERVDQEEFVSVCMEILRNARNEIYLSMRFLDVSLSSLYFAPDLAVRGIATDGSGLFFNPSKLAAMYKKSRIYVNRVYLHAVLHCLFCHIWNRKKRAEDYWNLACDIAVESIIDSLYRSCVHLPLSSARRDLYGRLEKKITVFNAESVYKALQDKNSYLAMLCAAIICHVVNTGTFIAIKDVLSASPVL